MIEQPASECVGVERDRVCVCSRRTTCSRQPLIIPIWSLEDRRGEAPDSPRQLSDESLSLGHNDQGQGSGG